MAAIRRVGAWLRCGRARRKGRSRRLLALSVTLALIVLASVGPTRVAFAAGAMSANALTSLFTSYGDTSGQWSGADSTASVPLPDGRVAWLFSDTFLGTVNADHSRPATSPLINNSLVVQDAAGQLVSTRYGGTASAPESLVKAPVSGEFYWVGDGTVTGSTLQVLYNRYGKTGSGSLDVALVGTALATFDLPALTLRGVTDLPLGSTVAWGSAILEDGAYTYVYGGELGSGADALKFAHLARVPAGGLAGAWQFWTGSGWSAVEANSARLLSGVGTAFGVQKVGSQYVLVTQQGNLVFDPDFVAYTAPGPTGPFSGPVELFTAPETDSDKPIIVYDARVHPELAQTGELLVSYNVNSLDSGDVYADARIYRPRFVDVGWPRPVPDPSTLPGAPTGLTASAGSDGQVRLSWQAPAGDGLQYWVYQRDVTAGQTHFARLRVPTPQTSATLALLQSDHVYQFRVTAANSAGEGPPSATVSASVHLDPPPAPASLTASAAADGSIVLAWQPVTGAWSYTAYRKDLTAGDTAFAKITSVGGGSTTLTINEAEPNHTYEFYVTATHGGGESAQSNHATATALLALPPAPSGLTATPNADGTIALSWTAPGTNLWYYVYQRDVTAGETGFTRLPLPITQGTTMTASYLTLAHTYEFKVTAINQAGEGPASGTVQATANVPPPGKPTGLTATPKSDGTIALSWTAPGTNLWYYVYQQDVTAGGNWQKLPLPITEGTTMTAGLLTQGHSYQFKVTAINSGGEGQASDVATATCHYAPPPAPTNLRGVSAGDGSIDLTWDAPGANLYYWLYERDVTAGETTFTKSAYPTDQTSASWGSLRDGHTYEFRVTAQNPGGEGSPSNTVQVVAHGGLPAPPTGLTATPGNGQVTLRWTASPSPSVLYVIYQRDVTAGQSWQKLPLPVSGTSMTAGYLTNGHTYEFKVTASNASGDSQPSNVASAKPMPPLPQPPSGLTASAGNGQVALHWTASPTSDVYYWIEYRANGSSWQRLKYPLSTCCSFTVGYLFNGTTYDFRVLATNLSGDSQPSNVASAKPMPPFPQAPSNLTATPGISQVTLSWSPSPTGNVLYWIYFRDASREQTRWIRSMYPVPGPSSFTLRDAFINGDAYQFKVTAANLTGESGATNIAEASPKPTKPQAVYVLTEPNQPSFLTWLIGRGDQSLWAEYNFIWSTDYCSKPAPSSQPAGFDFRLPCARHDFGYRNYTAMGTLPMYELMVDGTFLWDMLQVCADYSGPSHWLCVSIAGTYYDFVAAHSAL